MNTEPTPQDVAAVAQTLPQMQPTEPTPQPAPTQQPATQQPAPQPTAPTDPFAAFAQPTEPAPQPQPATPAQPTEPTPDLSIQAPQPTQPTEPAPQPATPTEPQYQSYEDYIKSINDGVGQLPEQPDPAKINPDNPEEIKGFFDNLMNTAVARAEQNIERKSAIQNTERRLWDEAFTKYGSLRDNKQLRDMVHNIRMGYFHRNVAITPTQAADELLKSLGNQYQKGVADSQVQTTIESVQPNAGGSTPIATTADRESVLSSVQSGGEIALAQYLDGEVKAGRL